MSVCTVCGSVLEADWKYCIRCGARTEVALDAERAPADEPPALVDPVGGQVTTDAPVLVDAPTDAPAAESVAAEPEPEPELAYMGLEPVESDPDGESEPRASAEPPVTSEPETEAAGEPEPESGGEAVEQPPRPFAASAVLALVMACVLSFLALPFGIWALVRVRRTGERGRVFAVVGIVLGAVWSVGLVVVIASLAQANGV